MATKVTAGKRPVARPAAQGKAGGAGAARKPEAAKTAAGRKAKPQAEAIDRRKRLAAAAAPVAVAVTPATKGRAEVREAAETLIKYASLVLASMLYLLLVSRG